MPPRLSVPAPSFGAEGEGPELVLGVGGSCTHGGPEPGLLSYHWPSL